MHKIVLLLAFIFLSSAYATDAKVAKPIPGIDVIYSPDSLTVPDSALQLMSEIKKGDTTVQAIYYKSGTIYATSKMQISFQRLNKKYFSDMTQDSFKSTIHIFCTLKEKAKETWPVIASYDYVYDIITIEDIWVGRITADPNKIECDDHSSK